jgi:predicted nucleic acid-binding protein
MSIINLTEVYYGLISEYGGRAADETMRIVEKLPIHIIETVNRSVYREAARFKATYKMSLADVFLCTTAKNISAVIVTKDRELEAAEQSENLSILWIV